MRFLYLCIIVFQLNTDSYGAQPSPNSCEIDEVGASEFTCSGFVKTKKDHVGSAYPLAESRLWKAAFRFCTKMNKNHELRSYKKYSPVFSKTSISILGGFRCLSR